MSLQLSAVIEEQVKSVETLSEISITTNEQNSRATLIIKNLRLLKKQVQETFRPHIKGANELWKNLLSDEKKYIEPIERCEGIIEEKMKQFLMAEKQRQVEAQRKADELAEKEAQRERDRLTKQAEKLSSKGKTDEAETKLAEAQTVVANAPIVQSRAEKQEGIIGVEKYTFQIVNELLIPREYLIPDMVKIRKYVNAMKRDARIPGVRIDEDLSIRVKV